MPGSKKVIELNTASDDVSKKLPEIKQRLGGKAVVLVWASWCPHCISMKPDWNYFKRTVRSDITIIEIESQNLEKIRHSNDPLFKKLYPDENRVMYPLIKSFNANKGRVYEQERTGAAMKKNFETTLGDGKTTKSNDKSKTVKKLADDKKKTGSKKRVPKPTTTSVKKGGDGAIREINSFVKDFLKKYKI
jgi:thiol-disulfide isomerase/thioredoxin